MAKRSLEERFWAKVDRRGADECWPWAGAKISTGYGEFWDGERPVLAHRWAYEHFVGPIPEGLDADHLCHNADPTCRGGRTDPHRLCVNYLRHLAPAAPRENILAGASPSARHARKTTCPKGHPYDSRNRRGRTCSICQRANKRAAYRKEHGGVVAPRNRDKTHCPRGHPYDDANTIRRKDGWRQCRTCKNAQRRVGQ